MSESNTEQDRKSEHEFRFDSKPDFAFVTVQVPISWA